MTQLHTEESLRERFEQLVRPFGAKGTICLVPEVSEANEFWVLHNLDKALFNFFLAERKALLAGIRGGVEDLREVELDEVARNWVRGYNDAIQDVLDSLSNEENNQPL